MFLSSLYNFHVGRIFHTEYMNFRNLHHVFSPHVVFFFLHAEFRLASSFHFASKAFFLQLFQLSNFTELKVSSQVYKKLVRRGNIKLVD